MNCIFKINFFYNCLHIFTSMYIEMCRPSSFNKTNEKNERNAENFLKNQHQDLGIIQNFVRFPSSINRQKSFHEVEIWKIYRIKCYMLFPSTFPFLKLKEITLYNKFWQTSNTKIVQKNDMIDEYILQTW